MRCTTLKHGKKENTSRLAEPMQLNFDQNREKYLQSTNNSILGLIPRALSYHSDINTHGSWWMPPTLEISWKWKYISPKVIVREYGPCSIVLSLLLSIWLVHTVEKKVKRQRERSQLQLNSTRHNVMWRHDYVAVEPHGSASLLCECASEEVQHSLFHAI